MNSQVPIILLDQSSAPAYSLFNPNEWRQKSKQIVDSCAINYGLLTYGATKIETVFGRANMLCQPRFQDLVAQWQTSKWNTSSCLYLVDIPEAHLSIHGFLSTLKTFLDVLVQLFYTEGIVLDRVHGFHRAGDKLGGRLLNMLSCNANKLRRDSAQLLYNLISEHKKLWIDQAVDPRDAFVHPERGLSKVMFALDLLEIGGELVLHKILKPSFLEKEFDIYAHETVTMVEAFSRKCIEYIKTA